MNSKIILALMLFTMFFIGFQTVQPAAAVTKIDQFAVYHMGGQSSDADVINVYSYSLNHIYIKYIGYMYNAKTHKYVKMGYTTWTDVKKITKTKLRITEPSIEGPNTVIYKYTKHSATYYYWHTLRYKLKHQLPF